MKLAEKFKNENDIIFLMIGSGEMKKECQEYIKKKN